MSKKHTATNSARIIAGLCFLAVSILLGITTKTFAQSCYVSAGGNQRMCANDAPIPIYGTSTSSNPIFSWSTNGDGFFDDPSTPTTVYSPGANDIANQSVQITLTVTCDEGTSTDVMTLTIASNPAPIITGSNLLCVGSTVDAGTGYDNYYWEWFGNQNFAGGYGTNETQVIGGSDTYYLTVDLNGCSGYASTYITAEGGTYDFSASASSLCTSSIIDLSLSASNPDDWYQLLWNGNPYGSTYQGDAYGGFVDFGNYFLDAGTYTVSSYFCNNLMNGSFTVTQDPYPVITDNILCAGSTIDAGAGYDNYYWEWYGSQNFAGGYGTNQSQVIGGSDTYYLTVDLNGCYGYASTYITAEGGTYNFIASGTSFCYSSSINLSLAASNPDDWYQLLMNGNPYGGTYPGDANGGAVNFGNFFLDPGTYTMKSVYCGNLMNGSYTILAGPDAQITPNGSTLMCSRQGHIVLQATPTGTNYSYSWVTPDNYSANTSTYNADMTGNYIVYVTNLTTGCSASNLIEFIVHTSPSPSITASGATTFCSGGSVTLDAGSYASYHWNTNATSEAIAATTSRNYLVTVTDGNGCTGTASRTVTVNTSPSVRITPNGTTTLCPGFNVSLDAGTYPSYIWNTSATTEYITTATAGTYSVTATSSNGCTGTASVNVTTVAFPNPVITGATTACSGTTITLGTTSAYPFYTWSNGATTSTIGVTTSGTYSVIVVNGTCSSSTSTTINFNASPVPSITATGIATYCTGTGNVTLNAGSPYSSYHWNTNASVQSITVTQSNPGTYSVTVSGSNGCTGSASSVVSLACNVPTFPAAPTTNIAATTAMANWILPTCYYSNSIRISKHNLNTWTTYTVTPNTHYTFSALTHNTSYDWQVRTNCNSALTNVSAWTTVQTFTTAARLEEGETEEFATTFDAYPNPAKDFLNIAFNTEKEEGYNIQLIDVTGRVISHINGSTVIGENQYQMNLANVSNGVYFVVLKNNNSIIQKKIMVN